MATKVRPKGTYADYLSGDYSDKVFVFELVKKNPVNALMKSKETGKAVRYPLSKMIPCVGTVYEKGPSGQMAPRKIRYVPGENSIYVDEQTPDDKFPKTKVFANWVNGRLTVDGIDSPRLNFFMKWDANETKEGRDQNKKAKFRLVDTTLMAKKDREKDKVKFDVVNWCYTADFLTKIEPFASLYFTHEQMSQNAEDIRWNLKIMAERNPAAFQRMLDDPNTERKIVVKQAIKKGFVVINVTQNSVAWAQNPNAPFSVAAPGVDPIEDFANKSKSGDGERYYKAICDLVNPAPATNTFIPPPVVESNTFTPPVNPIKSSAESDEELLIIVRAGVEKGLITISSNNLWWKYKTMSGRKEEGLAKELRDNPIALEILKKELLS
jgi:hypothetical protein